MKTLANIAMMIALAVMGLMYLGYLTPDDLKNVVLGEVTMGDTEQVYTEEDFRHVFDLIVGEVEVTDTSSTAFERSNPLCDKAYVMHTTDALIKYEVKTTPELFYVDVDNMTYYISDALGVTFHEADRENATIIKESNCVKANDISKADLKRTQKIAETNFRNAVQASDKIVEANARFRMVKKELIKSLQELNFVEQVPENVFKN